VAGAVFRPALPWHDYFSLCAHGARFSLWPALLACTKPLAVSTSNMPSTTPVAAVTVVPGVSRELADDRARRISRLGYNLNLTVLPQKTSLLRPRKTLRFI